MLPVGNDKVLWLDYRGAPQTVGLLQRTGLEGGQSLSVRRLAEQFCSQLDSKDYASEYLACHYGLLQTTRYMRDPRTVELVRSPAHIADEILGGGRPNLDCDDYTEILTALTLAVGGSAEIVTVAFRRQFYRGLQQYSHVFCRAVVPQTGVRVVLDPVAESDISMMLKRVVAAKIWPVA